MLKHQATVLNSFAVRTKDQATPLHSFAVCKKNFALVFGSEAAGDGSLIALASGEISAMGFGARKGRWNGPLWPDAKASGYRTEQLRCSNEGSSYLTPQLRCL